MPKKTSPVPLWQAPLYGEAPNKKLLQHQVRTYRKEMTVRSPRLVYIGQKTHRGRDNFPRIILYYRDEGFYHYNAYYLQGGSNSIGELRLDGFDEAERRGEHALSGITVEDRYRRCGIGTALINFANITNSSQNGTRLIVFGGQEHNSRYRLTNDGMQLILNCIKGGILDHDQFLGNQSLGSPER